jgi:branched-chain amino acid transport system substrate-binding protein
MNLGSMVRRGLFALGVSAVVAAPAFSQSGPPIRIGAVLSVTGPASFLGDPEDKTLRLYVNRINQAGGLNGRPIQLIVYDDGGDANGRRHDHGDDDGDAPGLRGSAHSLHQLGGRH